MKIWLTLATRRDVVMRSLRVALVVGSVLALINYTDRALTGSLRVADWIKIGLTYLVPYGVSTYAAVEALRQTHGAAGIDHPADSG